MVDSTPRRVGWREKLGGEATCVRCLETRDATDLDRLHWCVACREAARARTGRVGWIVGASVGGVLALWLGLIVRPSVELIPGGWLAALVALVWLASRITREIGYGVLRYQNESGAEADTGDS